MMTSRSWSCRSIGHTLSFLVENPLLLLLILFIAIIFQLILSRYSTHVWPGLSPNVKSKGTLRLKTFWNVVKGMGSLKIGDGVMFKVRNNYDPELDGEGDVFWEPFVEEFSALLKDAHVEEEPEEDAAADWCELLDLEGEAFWYNKRSCQVQLGRPANL